MMFAVFRSKFFPVVISIYGAINEQVRDFA